MRTHAGKLVEAVVLVTLSGIAARMLVIFAGLAVDFPNGASEYPAFAIPLPSIENAGGPIVGSPHLTSITFGDDSRAADLDAFVSSLGSSAAWTGILAQYGVTQISATPPVHAPALTASTINDSLSGGASDVHTFLESMLDGTHAGFPLADSNAIYVLFYPSNTNMTLDGKALSGVAAYHSSLRHE